MNLKMKQTYWAPEGDGGAGAGGAGAGAGAGDGAAGGAGAAGSGAAAGTWPADWRENLAKGADGKPDEKVLDRLKRFSDPSGIWQSFRNLEAKQSSGELVPKLSKDATPEQIAAYRQANGIPEAPDKYEIKLREGLVIGEEDKPVIEEFAKRLHGKNVSNEVMSGFVEAYYDILETQAQKATEEAGKRKQATEDALRKEWGEEFRPNQTRIQNLIEANLPVDSPLKAKLQRTIERDPDFAKMMDALARQIMPVTTLLPQGQGGLAASVDTEIAEIEKLMRTDRNAYNKDVKKQERYQELLAFRDRQKAA